jgi:hypothetical protein
MDDTNQRSQLACSETADPQNDCVVMPCSAAGSPGDTGTAELGCSAKHADLSS